MKDNKNSDDTKGYQFSVRISEPMLKNVEKRLKKLNFTTLAEYIRHLMTNDIHREKANHE